MKIAVSYSKFGSSRSGGARESLLTLLQGVAKNRDITVDVYQTPPVDDPPDTNFKYTIYEHQIHNIPKLSWVNQVFTRRQWKKYLLKQLSPNYDLLITQNALAPISVQIAAEFEIPSLFFVRSMALTGYEKYDPFRSHLSNFANTDIGGRIQYPFLWKNFQEYKRAAQLASYTIANSEFTASLLDELFDVAGPVINPPINLEQYRVEYNSNGFITMVNPRAAYKGADIFLDIADKMPDEEFLLVGPISSSEIKSRAQQAQNVRHWEWCDDMREAYSTSKLVVVPSRVEESFGRVPAEAMVSGIPTVVSNRGNLPNVVGQTGEIVDEINSIEEWIGKINRAIKNHDPRKQMRRAENFSAEGQIQILQEILKEV